MKRGKKICDTLKEVRMQVAKANDIKYAPTEFHHEGDCAGTCPKCESDTTTATASAIRQSRGRGGGEHGTLRPNGV